jgi:hypothetical protein
METTFLVCAIAGGTFVVAQILAGMLGIGDGDHDGFDHDTGDAGHGAFFGVLSIRAISAALMFFGLGGMTALHYGASEGAAFGIALGAGAATLYAVAYVMKSLANLKSDGTARIERAIGLTGTVYLRVPASRAGSGKIQMMLQNRTVEYQAVTTGNEIPTGAIIKVVAVVNSDTVEVEAA